MSIYKILLPEQWQQWQQAKVTKGTQMDINDGYIHFSSLGEIPLTLSLYFKTVEKVILLEVEESKVTDDLKWEFVPARNVNMPHVFRSLTLDDVKLAHEVKLVDGVHDLSTVMPKA